MVYHKGVSNITFDGGSFRIDTFTKEAKVPSIEEIKPFEVYVDKKPRGLLSADDIPFFFVDSKSLAYGGAVLDEDDVKNEIILKKFKPVIEERSFDKNELIVYLGPSLTFSHISVERPFILDLMGRGYRAAAKRTDGVDYFDMRVMVLVMLRKLGIPFDNIHLDTYDTFECSALLYSTLRGDTKKNVSLLSIE